MRSDDGVGRLAGRCRLTMAVAVDVVSALGRGDGGTRDGLSSTGGESTAVSWFRTRGGSLEKPWTPIGVHGKTHMPRRTSATGSIRQVDLVRAMRQYAHDLCFTPVVFVVSKSHGLADGNRRPMLSRPIIIVDSLATFGICQRALSSRRGRRR